jgi:hypothetical protein
MCANTEKSVSATANFIPVDFPLLDRYLLEGKPPKEDVVSALLRTRPEAPGAAPFYEGMKILGPRTPDLSLMALRLVLAGKKADDGSVKSFRAIVERARKGGEDAAAAIASYKEALE